MSTEISFILFYLTHLKTNRILKGLIYFSVSTKYIFNILSKFIYLFVK